MQNPFWQNHRVATLLVTLYLVVYTFLHQSGASLRILGAMFLLSPFLVGWMAYTILKHAPYKGRELAADEEWGYGDRTKDQLGKF
jgi:hypothetical protein